MTLQTAVVQGAELLAASGTPQPRLTAELLLCHAVHCERTYLFAHPEQDLREVEWIHYGRWLHERMQGKPLQYITRTQEFYGRPFRVSPSVLIPRPETEILVETVLKRRPGARSIVDVGAGSGAIAVTLALETQTWVIATDISLPALQVAAWNASTLNARVSLIAADLLSVIPDSSVDVVVSNPPYVAVGERETMQREVRDWEPHIALFAGDEGLDIYRRLIPEAARVLRPGGLLAFEFGFAQADAVKDLVAGWGAVEVTPDLAGIPRILSCERRPQL
ncbi:MAG TPA: peptide chain release factor N(5)-glutamine methyltransferase [Bryobacteraceae bacterium]